MVFRDTRQRVAVCRALCERSSALRVDELFDFEGATPLAASVMGGQVASHGWAPSDRALFNLAWQLWRYPILDLRSMSLVGLLGPLDRANQAAVGNLIVALAGGPELVDAWVQLEQLEAAKRRALARDAAVRRLEVVR